MSTKPVASRKDIFKAIHRSQHCQRNWNLEESMPQEDVDMILEAVTQCPSKQNASFYKIHAIQDRELIEKMHALTKGFGIRSDLITTNSQTLAHLVVVFEAANREDQIKRLSANYDVLGWPITEEMLVNEYFRDVHMAVGVAAGYSNLTASMLGYSTGCCACFDGDGIKEMLNLEDAPMLMMGIGIPGDKNRRIHHLDETIKFPTKRKQPIEVITH